MQVISMGPIRKPWFNVSKVVVSGTRKDRKGGPAVEHVEGEGFDPATGKKFNFAGTWNEYFTMCTEIGLCNQSTAIVYHMVNGCARTAGKAIQAPQYFVASGHQDIAVAYNPFTVKEDNTSKSPVAVEAAARL